VGNKLIMGVENGLLGRKSVRALVFDYDVAVDCVGPTTVDRFRAANALVPGLGLDTNALQERVQQLFQSDPQVLFGPGGGDDLSHTMHKLVGKLDGRMLGIQVRDLVHLGQTRNVLLVARATMGTGSTARWSAPADVRESIAGGRRKSSVIFKGRE
jgi:hypothetical protein